MDIDLLAKMVKDLLLLNDRVSLPGLGCFIAEMVPASFSDKGYTINPPYRRLYFRSRPNDGALLVKYYAESNGVTEEQARQTLEEYVKELVEVLKEKKLIVFPKLGRLRATKENNFFFVSDEDADIYPEGFGLDAVSLKSHKEELSSKLWEAAVGDLADAVEKMTDVEEIELAAGEEVEESAEPEEREVEKEREEKAETESVEEQLKEDVSEHTEVGEVAVEPEKNEEQENGAKVEDTGEEKVGEEKIEEGQKPLTEEEKYAAWKAKQEAEKNKRKKVKKEKSDKPKKKHTWLWILIAVLLVCALLAAAWYVLTNYYPDLLNTWLDSILYTPEELEILGIR